MTNLQLVQQLRVGSVGNRWNTMPRFVGRGVGDDRSSWERSWGITLSLVSFASSFYFYLTEKQERGTRKRDEVKQFSSRPAEYRTEGERAGEQRKRTIHLP